MGDVTTIDPGRFRSGYTWEEYLDLIDRNRDQFELYYDALELTGGEIEWIRGLDRTTHVLAIGEPWCPDVFTNLPVVSKLASYNPDRIVVRVFARDEQDDGTSPPPQDVGRSPDPARFKNHDLMSRYLYGERQSMSIPAVGFFDENWKEFGRFVGGRPRLYWHWIDTMGKERAVQERMGEFMRHNRGREMFWEIRRILELR
jgi:hypothetical protein